MHITMTIPIPLNWWVKGSFLGHRWSEINSVYPEVGLILLFMYNFIMYNV